MAELRAYALAVTELRGLVSGGRAEQERFRELAREAFAPAAAPRVRDLLGPIYRRVPGAPVVRDDDPAPAELDALLSGRVRAERAAATWRLVEAVVARAAAGSTSLPALDLPADLLAPTGLPVPPVAGLTVGWCTRQQATVLTDLRKWLAAAEGWSAAAREAGRAEPDVICFVTGRA